MRKRALILLACTVVALLTSTASATLVRYEPFNYSAVGTPVEGKTNPDGATWVQAYATPSPNAINVSSGSLALPSSMPPSIGNSAEIDGSGNGAGKALRLSLGQTFDQTLHDGTTIYYSFALRADALTGSNNANGGFFIGLTSASAATTVNPTNVAARLQARIDPTDGTKYNLGIFNNRNAVAASASWSSIKLDVGTTYFVVASNELNDGASNDVARLWINPVLNGVEPVPSAIDLTFATNDQNIGSIILRQSPAPHVTLDELRIGTTWADVTAIPEASPVLALLLVSALLVAARTKVWKLLGT